MELAPPPLTSSYLPSPLYHCNLHSLPPPSPHCHHHHHHQKQQQQQHNPHPLSSIPSPPSFLSHSTSIFHSTLLFILICLFSTSFHPTPSSSFLSSFCSSPPSSRSTSSSFSYSSAPSSFH
ncbi:unnamed protein product [Protopolystoma xenopodis]|uniref:Uncharacterized protein n=1 Tax=Protopolystoma xenopodis TaxID=117903 RepID=A0A3S5FCZ0_9PLAT|nr:unnamed protein product [Protopolystoma xenopodis]